MPSLRPEGPHQHPGGLRRGAHRDEDPGGRARQEVRRLPLLETEELEDELDEDEDEESDEESEDDELDFDEDEDAEDEEDYDDDDKDER